MLVKDCRNIIFRRGLASNLNAFELRIVYAGFYSSPNHLQFEFREDASHFEERRGHRIDLTATAVDGDASDDNQSKFLLLDRVDDLTKLLRGTAETGNFKCDDGISLSRRLQEHMEILFDLGVSVFVFKYDFFCASCFKLETIP